MRTIFNIKNSTQIKNLIKHTLILVIVAATTTSCLKDDGYSLDKFWIDYGVISGDNKSFTIVTDNGKVLFPSASAISLVNVKDSMRVIVNYTILGDAPQSDLDYYVKINGMQLVLKKDILTFEEAVSDSIGNDGLKINNVWLTPKYDLLNVEFQYPGSPYHAHMINLVINPENKVDEDGNIILELRHNKKGDPYTNPLLSGRASFDLRSIRQDGATKVGFVLKSKGITPDSDYSETGVYEYGDSNSEGAK